MKIAIDTSRYNHKQATGVEWYSWHIINGLLKELAHSKHEITLLSPQKIKLPIEISGKVKNVKKEVVKGKRWWTLCHLSKKMKNGEFDVLFVPSHVLPLKLPKKSVIMIHDVAFMHLRDSYSLKQHLYLKWSTKFAVKNATTILVPSAATKNDLVKLFKCPIEKIKVIHHGFSKPEVTDNKIKEATKKSLLFKHFTISEKGGYMLFVGRLETKKNLQNLLKGFALFLKNHEDYKLVLAGKPGVGFNDVLAVIKTLGIEKNVIMPGYISEVEKAMLYKYCDFFVFPSLYEGFGIPILETFYWKKPLLTSYKSSLHEIAQDGAHYIDPYDIYDIALGIEKLAVNTEYRKRLVTLGTERLKDFSWKTASKETVKVLTEEI